MANTAKVDTAKVETAFLEWMNSFPLSEEITSLKDLDNGVLLWEALRDIDSLYFAHRLPMQDHEVDLPNDWIARWENLRQVHKSATTYIQEECYQVISLRDFKTPDLQALARTASRPDTILLLKIILAAAINSAQRSEFIMRIQNLTKPTQEAFMEIIEGMQASSPKQTNGTLRGSSMDRELLLETQLGRALAEKSRLLEVERAYEEQSSRLTRALDEKDTLNDLLKGSQDEVARLNGSAEKKSTALLEDQLNHQSEIILAYEATIENLQQEGLIAQRQLETYRSATKDKHTLRDEIDVLRIERDNYAKKANTADKYKQKLEASQQIERENQSLRAEIAEIREWKKTVESPSSRVAGLERALEEYRTTLARSEQDHEALRMTRLPYLQDQNRSLSRQIESLLEQRDQDYQLIHELRDKANREPVMTAETPDLGSELTAHDEHSNALIEGTSRLKVDNQKLKDDTGAGPWIAQLQHSLDDTNAKYKRLEAKFLIAQEEKLELEGQLSAIYDAGSVSQEYVPKPKPDSLIHSVGSTEAFLSLRQKHDQANAEVIRLEEVLWQTTLELTKTASLLSNAETDLSLIDKDKLDALQELKQANSTEVVAIRAERDKLVDQVQSHKVEISLQKDLLNKALLNKDSAHSSIVSKTDELRDTEKANTQMRGTLDLLNAASNGRHQGTSEDLENYHVALSKKIEIGRENVARRNKHIEKLNQVVKDLQDRLRKFEEVIGNGAVKGKEALSQGQKESRDEEIKNLKRENALMTTAWYELTSRLQTNNVVLQRRSEEPKSWLNKQRQLLNTTIRR